MATSPKKIYFGNSSQNLCAVYIILLFKPLSFYVVLAKSTQERGLCPTIKVGIFATFF